MGKGLGYLVYFVQEMQDYWHLVPWEKEVERHFEHLRRAGSEMGGDE